MALTVSLNEIIAGGNALLAIKPHWKRVRLGDVGQVLNGFAFKAELFTREGGMPLIRIRDVGSTASETFYSGDFDERYAVIAGDLLVGMDGDFNCARWRGPRSLLNQRVCKITLDESLYLPRFLDYVLPGYLKAINDATSSVTVKHLSSRTIQDIPLPLPPMAEQREIVAEIEKQFSRLDEAVVNLQRVKANLKRYKASVLKAAVEGRLVETEASLARREGRTYETGEQLLQRILEERRANWNGKGKYKEPLCHDSQSLPDAPEGWAWCSLDVVAEETLLGLDRGRDQQRTEPIGVRYVKMNNVSMDGDVQTDELVYVDASQEEVARYELANGDLLFNTRNSLELVGKVGIVRSMQIGTVFNNNLMRIRTYGDVSSVFLGYQMCAHDFRQRMEKVKKATTSVAAVYQKDLLPLPIALPPAGEQARIVAEVDRHLSIIREVEAEVDVNLKRGQALRQATLVKAFSIN